MENLNQNSQQKKIRIAINGFGRIGRTFFKQAFEVKEFEIVAINDLGDIENLAYLLKYDTVYGRYKKSIEVKKPEEQSFSEKLSGKLIVEGKEILVYSEREPQNLPWGDLDIDVVIESTGVFTDSESAQKHLEAGAKRVVITAPAKGEVFHVLAGTNIDKFEEIKIREIRITSNASCTTNATSPVVAVLEEAIGIEKAIMTTIHAYTATQNLVDGPTKKKDFLRGRAAAQNIVPSHTGAAEAVAKSLPYVKEKFDAIAIRIPVITGSLVDFTFLAKRNTTVEEINNIFREASKTPRWKNILKVSEEPLVSSDIIGESYGAIIDLNLTKVVGGNMVKVFSWYDNEWGYCATLIWHIKALF